MNKRKTLLLIFLIVGSACGISAFIYSIYSNIHPRVQYQLVLRNYNILDISNEPVKDVELTLKWSNGSTITYKCGDTFKDNYFYAVNTPTFLKWMPCSSVWGCLVDRNASPSVTANITSITGIPSD